MALVPAGEAVGQAPPGEENSPGFSCRGVTGQLGASVNNVGLQYLDDPSKKNTWGGAIAIGFQTGR